MASSPGSARGPGPSFGAATYHPLTLKVPMLRSSVRCCSPFPYEELGLRCFGGRRGKGITDRPALGRAEGGVDGASSWPRGSSAVDQLHGRPARALPLPTLILASRGPIDVRTPGWTPALADRARPREIGNPSSPIRSLRRMYGAHSDRGSPEFAMGIRPVRSPGRGR